MGNLPEYIYSTSVDGLYVNLYAPWEITSDQGGGDVTLKTKTSFPFDSAVSMKGVSTQKIMLPAVAYRHAQG